MVGHTDNVGEFSYNMKLSQARADAVVEKLVTDYGARPTHPGADAVLDELKDDLDTYASEYGELADAEWYREHQDQRYLRASGQ